MRPSLNSSRVLLVSLSLSLAMSGLAASLPAAAATQIVVNPGDLGERSRFETYTELKSIVAQAMRRERLPDADITLSMDATADLATTRSRIPDAFVAPAHVVGSAVRYGYVPLVSLTPSVQAVLVASREQRAKDFATARGLRLGLPTQDSVVTYLLRGEANAANTTIRRHFGSLFESRYQEALLVCLQLRRCDVIAVERALYDRWVAAGEPLKIVAESRAVPGLSVAVKPGPVTALRDALLASADSVPGKSVAALDAGAFDYVATLGYFTPRGLPGARLVDAPAVVQLMKDGALYVDTRSEAEYRAGRVPKARWIPYVEKSAKDADYDRKLDRFDVSALPKDRNAPLVFACNGPECWKSFKASAAAVAAGYKRVHWFRGGFPEWRSAGLEIERDT